MSRSAWYKLQDRFEPGVVIGNFQEYEYTGGPTGVAGEVDHAVVAFPGDTATDNFIDYCKAVSEDFETKRRVYALNLQHVALNEASLAALSSITPVKYLDLRGHELTVKQLLSIYRRVGSSCQLVLDDKQQLLSFDSNDPPGKTRFKLPQGSFKHEHVLLSDLLSFLQRVHIRCEAADFYLADFITDLDLRKTHILMDKFVRAGVDLMPSNLTTLRLAGITGANFDEVIWDHLSKLTELDISDCGFEFDRESETSAFLAGLSNVKTMRCEGVQTSFVSFMQLNAAIDRLKTRGREDLIPPDAVIDTTYGSLVDFSLKYGELIRSQLKVPVADASESKHADAAESQSADEARSLFAIGEYLRMSNLTFRGDKRVACGVLQRNLKKVHMPGVFYRNLPAENFVEIPPTILADIRQLFPQITLWQTHQGATVMRDLLAAHSILLSPDIEKRTGVQAILFEAPISVKRLDALFVKLSKELPIVQGAYAHYTKNNIDHMAKFRHIEQIRNGMIMALGACMSMRDRAQKDALSGEATIEFTVEDAQAMLQYRAQMLAPTEAAGLAPEEAATGAAVSTVLAASAGLFGGAKTPPPATGAADGKEPDSDESSDDEGDRGDLAYDTRPLPGVGGGYDRMP
ncbi:MAG: hypothetical protein P1U40_11420 [Coxiellaceae bacterium]|nr:hypothetical protein [Coxiellaceae bacterium]